MTEVVCLSQEERLLLLTQARKSLETVVHGKILEPIQLDEFPSKLRQHGVAFVTLTINEQLRGCVGGLQAVQPLVEDVREHAVAAALQDYRFPPVKPDELAKITIEISRLTPPTQLEYEEPEDLLIKLQPGIDGVVLRTGFQRATFLPQVWEKLPSTDVFLDHLCLKMGFPAELWRQQMLDVQVYQVEIFKE